jgi:hypothetical protein
VSAPATVAAAARAEPARARASSSRTVILDDTGPMPRSAHALPPAAPVSTDVTPAHDPGFSPVLAVGVALLAVSAVVAVWLLLT